MVRKCNDLTEIHSVSAWSLLVPWLTAACLCVAVFFKNGRKLLILNDNKKGGYAQIMAHHSSCWCPATCPVNTKAALDQF